MFETIKALLSGESLIKKAYDDTFAQFRSKNRHSEEFFFAQHRPWIDELSLQPYRLARKPEGQRHELRHVEDGDFLFKPLHLPLTVVEV